MADYTSKDLVDSALGTGDRFEAEALQDAGRAGVPEIRNQKNAVPLMESTETIRFFSLCHEVRRFFPAEGTCALRPDDSIPIPTFLF